MCRRKYKFTKLCHDKVFLFNKLFNHFCLYAFYYKYTCSRVNKGFNFIITNNSSEFDKKNNVNFDNQNDTYFRNNFLYYLNNKIYF